MALFFSQRAYNAQTKKFTNNAATLTRFVVIDAQTSGTVSQGDWLDLVAAQGGRDAVLVFVHGFNTRQTEMLERLGKIEAGLRTEGYRGTVVAFDWPSDGVLTAYDPDRRDAKKVAPHLVGDGILPLLGMPGQPKVHLLAHSMGAYLTLRGFSDFGDSAGGPGAAWGLD
jgi:esterase/lipase superfamily enzyme